MGGSGDLFDRIEPARGGRSALTGRGNQRLKADLRVDPRAGSGLDASLRRRSRQNRPMDQGADSGRVDASERPALRQLYLVSANLEHGRLWSVVKWTGVQLWPARRLVANRHRHGSTTDLHLERSRGCRMVPDLDHAGRIPLPRAVAERGQ